MRSADPEPVADRRTNRVLSFPQETPMKYLKQFFALAMILTALTSLTACNTMKGAGKDIERGGDAIQDAAD